MNEYVAARLAARRGGQNGPIYAVSIRHDFFLVRHDGNDLYSVKFIGLVIGVGFRTRWFILNLVLPSVVLGDTA